MLILNALIQNIIRVDLNALSPLVNHMRTNPLISIQVLGFLFFVWTEKNGDKEGKTEFLF